MQELVGNALDFRRHGRREEQGLPGKRHQFADALDVGNETHVEHAVGFVDHQQLDAGEQQSSAFGVVEQAAWCRDQNVDAADKFGVLVVERNAADDERDIELVVLAVFLEVIGNLRGEFARRLEDERARHARTRAALFEHCEHRQNEGSGLAGARLRNAQHIATCKHVRNGLVLDGSGGFVACRFDGGENFGG